MAQVFIVVSLLSSFNTNRPVQVEYINPCQEPATSDPSSTSSSVDPIQLLSIFTFPGTHKDSSRVLDPTNNGLLCECSATALTNITIYASVSGDSQSGVVMVHTDDGENLTVNADMNGAQNLRTGKKSQFNITMRDNSGQFTAVLAVHGHHSDFSCLKVKSNRTDSTTSPQHSLGHSMSTTTTTSTTTRPTATRTTMMINMRSTFKHRKTGAAPPPTTVNPVENVRATTSVTTAQGENRGQKEEEEQEAVPIKVLIAVCAVFFILLVSVISGFCCCWKCREANQKRPKTTDALEMMTIKQQNYEEISETDFSTGRNVEKDPPSKYSAVSGSTVKVTDHASAGTDEHGSASASSGSYHKRPLLSTPLDSSQHKKTSHYRAGSHGVRDISLPSTHSAPKTVISRRNDEGSDDDDHVYTVGDDDDDGDAGVVDEVDGGNEDDYYSCIPQQEVDIYEDVGDEEVPSVNTKIRPVTEHHKDRNFPHPTKILDVKGRSKSVDSNQRDLHITIPLPPIPKAKLDNVSAGDDAEDYVTVPGNLPSESSTDETMRKISQVTNRSMSLGSGENAYSGAGKGQEASQDTYSHFSKGNGSETPFDYFDLNTATTAASKTSPKAGGMGSNPFQFSQKVELPLPPTDSGDSVTDTSGDVTYADSEEEEEHIYEDYGGTAVKVVRKVSRLEASEKNKPHVERKQDKINTSLDVDQNTKQTDQDPSFNYETAKAPKLSSSHSTDTTIIDATTDTKSKSSQNGLARAHTSKPKANTSSPTSASTYEAAATARPVTAIGMLSSHGLQRSSLSEEDEESSDSDNDVYKPYETPKAPSTNPKAAVTTEAKTLSTEDQAGLPEAIGDSYSDVLLEQTHRSRETSSGQPGSALKANVEKGTASTSDEVESTPVTKTTSFPTTAIQQALTATSIFKSLPLSSSNTTSSKTVVEQPAATTNKDSNPSQVSATSTVPETTKMETSSTTATTTKQGNSEGKMDDAREKPYTLKGPPDLVIETADVGIENLSSESEKDDSYEVVTPKYQRSPNLNTRENKQCSTHDTEQVGCDIVAGRDVTDLKALLHTTDNNGNVSNQKEGNEGRKGKSIEMADEAYYSNTNENDTGVRKGHDVMHSNSDDTGFYSEFEEPDSPFTPKQSLAQEGTRAELSKLKSGDKVEFFDTAF